MLKETLQYLNALITPLGFRAHELTGLITRTSDDGDVTFPAIYAKRGEFTAVNAEQSVVYHRLLSGPTDTDDEEDNSPVSNTIITRTYGMRAVAIFPLDLYGADDQYQEDKVIRNLAGQLKHRQIKTLKRSLSLIELSVQPGDSSRGVEAWEDEFSGIDYVHKVRIVAVDYEITFRGFEDCITAAGCDDAVIDVVQAIKDEYCTDSCASGSVTVNNTAFGTVASGGTLDVPVEYENGSDVGSLVGGVWTIPDIPPCDPASITVNGDSPALSVASGASQDIANVNSAGTPIGTRSGATITNADASISANGDAVATVVAEGSIDIDVEYETAGTVPTTIVGGVITVPDPPAGASVGATLMKTGQTVSYAAGDDGGLQEGRATDFFTLASNNPFGNTNRFTDELGGQTYTNSIVIDWSTFNGSNVYGYYIVALTGLTWASAISACNALTVSTFLSGWRLPNVVEMLNIFLYEGATANVPLNYSPLGLTFSTFFWTSTTNAATTANAMVASNSTSSSTSTLSKALTFPRYIAIRTFTVTGTVLT